MGPDFHFQVKLQDNKSGPFNKFQVFILLVLLPQAQAVDGVIPSPKSI